MTINHFPPLCPLSGADDLLPILSFVALRCQCPQLLSECAALEEFIHERRVIVMETANKTFFHVFF